MCPGSDWGGTSWTSSSFTGQSTCDCESTACVACQEVVVPSANVNYLANMDVDAGQRSALLCPWHPCCARVFWRLLPLGKLLLLHCQRCASRPLLDV